MICDGFAKRCVENGPSEAGEICAWTEDYGGGTCVGPNPEADAEEGSCTYEGCDATVAEIEACIRVAAQASGADTQRADCAKAGDGEPPSPALEQAMQNSACKTVIDKCPDL